MTIVVGYTPTPKGQDGFLARHHRRSPVGRLILGSNSQQILVEATCLVLPVYPGGAA